jgi:hypothetical protein
LFKFKSKKSFKLIFSILIKQITIFPEIYKGFRLDYGLRALVCWLNIALEGWFYSVIYRAYKFMKFNNGQYEGDAAAAAGQFPSAPI